MLAGKPIAQRNLWMDLSMKFPIYMIREDPFHPPNPRSILLWFLRGIAESQGGSQRIREHRGWTEKVGSITSNSNPTSEFGLNRCGASAIAFAETRR
jgi:hypothetical protein